MTGDNDNMRRGGARRRPVSCLACRKHKLRCNRQLPCDTCIRYRREAQCREYPALARSRKTFERATNKQLQPTATEDSVIQIHSDHASRTVTEGRIYDQGHNSKERTQYILRAIESLATFDIGRTPHLSLPQILAEASRAAKPSCWWNMLDVRHRQRLWKQQLSAVLPSRAQCDLLLNYYLEHINWLFQTVHVPSFRREYAKFWDHGLDHVDLVWLSLLFTIISLSALYVPLEVVEVVGCPKDFIRHLANIWHLASQHALRAGEFEARPCLFQLQTFSITQLYWYATNQIETLNSRLGQAIRNAQALNLDRDTKDSNCLQDEMRHRIWWDLVDSDMFQTICLDRSPLIRLQGIKVPLPLNCNDSDITEASIHPRPMNEPTEMSMNIYRARAFRILNRNYFLNEDRSYERTLQTDTELVDLMENLPWYFKLDEKGIPQRLPQPLCETLTWQNHILRTCVSTQRIRMYRPFLAARIGNSWIICVKAAEDAMAVYRTLRADESTTSRQKFLPQAYQIFSVAVTVVALMLVEGSLPITNVYQQIRDMASDLKIMEDQGCPVPVVTQGRRALLKMLDLYDSRARGSASAENMQNLVPDIASIIGGENVTRTYLDRLRDSRQLPLENPTIERPQLPHPQEPLVAGDSGMHEDTHHRMASPPSSFVPFQEDMEASFDQRNPEDNMSWLALLNWDMTGFLLESQNEGHLVSTFSGQ